MCERGRGKQREKEGKMKKGKKQKVGESEMKKGKREKGPERKTVA